LMVTPPVVFELTSIAMLFCWLLSSWLIETSIVPELLIFASLPD